MHSIQKENQQRGFLHVGFGAVHAEPLRPRIVLRAVHNAVSTRILIIIRPLMISWKSAL